MSDNENQTRSKEELEWEKLDLEVKSLRVRSDKEKEKTELDLDNLRRTFRRTLTIAVLSATVPMTIAALGWTIQSHWQQEAAARTDQYRREELYNKMIESLGSENPSLRLAAVAGLSQYARPGSRLGDRETSDQVIAALIVRLGDEGDVSIQGEIFRTLGPLGKNALHPLAIANRRAAVQFVQASAELTGSLLLKKSITQDSNNAFPEMTKIITNKLPDYLRPVSEALGFAAAADRPTSAPSTPTPQKSPDESTSQTIGIKNESKSSGEMRLAGLYLYGSYNNIFHSQLNLVLSSKPDNIDNAIRTAVAAFRKSASSLVATNILLERVLTASSGKLKGENLEGMVIIWADLKKVNLEGVLFRNAFLRADVEGANLSFCDFSNSVLMDLSVARSNFTGATITNAYIPVELDWIKDEDFPALNGANWWDAFDLGSEGEPIKPDYLNRKYPESVQREERTKLLGNWSSQN